MAASYSWVAALRDDVAPGLSVGADERRDRGECESHPGIVGAMGGAVARM